MCGCVCVFSVFVSVCGCVCVCVSSLCLLTLMNEPNIRAICYQSSINQPQITSGNMFLKRASDVRCCLLWVSLCINQRGYARSCVCVWRLAQYSHIASVESTVWKWSDGLVSPDNGLQAPTILSFQLYCRQFTSVQLLRSDMPLDRSLIPCLKYLAYHSMQPVGARISHWTQTIFL